MLDDYSYEVEKVLEIDGEEEDEPSTPTWLIKSPKSSTRSQELQQPQQKQGRGKHVDFLNID